MYHLKIFPLLLVGYENLKKYLVKPQWSFRFDFTFLCSSKSTHAKLVSEEILQSRSMKVATNFGWYFVWDCKASSTRSEYHLTTFFLFRCSAFIVFTLHCLLLLVTWFICNMYKFQSYFFRGKTFKLPF